MKRIYLATPVNGRKEKTLAEKREAAFERVQAMQQFLERKYPNAAFVSGFSVCPIGTLMYESDIMGGCVRLVMESDLVVMDENWRDSRGCWVEQMVAQQYGIKIESFARLVLLDRIGE